MMHTQSALPADNDGLLARPMHFLSRVRPDLQAVFDLNGVEGIRAYRNWFEVSAPREYGLDVGLASPPTSQSAGSVQVHLLPSIPPGQPNSGKPWLYRRRRKARKWHVERV